MDETAATAVVLLVAGVVVGACVLATRLSAPLGVPIYLLFVVTGMLVGEDGVGGIAFADYASAFRIGSAALVLILFDAGLSTPIATLRRYLAPSLVLATLGVVLTAALLAFGARLLGFGWAEAALIGAVVSSTDAAAVLSVLRSGGVQLRERVGATLEIESGMNDPMAILLTTSVTAVVVGGGAPSAGVFGEVVLQLLLGAGMGAGLGVLARKGLRRLELPVGALYPVLTVGIALVIFGATTLVGGSGFLAVYLAGMMIGDARLPFRSALARVHDFVGWTGQVGIFVLLGLLATPSRIVAVTRSGIEVALILAFLARPLAVVLCLVPFRFSKKEIAFMAWIGLRGAVPIVLATIPVLAGAPGASRVFDVVFFVVVISAALQGGTVRGMAKWLGVGRRAPPIPPAVLEMTATRPLGHDLVLFEVHAASAVCGAPLADVPMPESAAVMLVVRGDDLVAARGPTELLDGDVVYVFCQKDDRPELELLFGRHRDA